jgi:NADPH:quinone reductase-like Zn-dependent oxidoreductase
MRKFTEFKVGDAVFATDDSSMGCHAEFKIIPASGTIAMKPENLSFEQAAAITFGGHTALSFLHK